MNELVERKILVTGGAGFIGSEVVRQLHGLGADITVLDNFSSGKIEYIGKFEGIKIIKGDIRDKDIVAEAIKNQELVVHLAALPFIPDCYNYPKEFFEVNTMGSINLLSQSIQSETVEKFVQISSSEVYGTAKYVPMDENHPTFPHSTYAVSKLAADRAMFTMHKEHNFPVVIVRPFNSYGPNITQPYIIPEIITQIHSNCIHLGFVNSSRDFTYVTDTVKGILLASIEKRAAGETINIGSGKDVTIENLVYLIANVLNKGGQVKIESDKERFRPYDVNRLICDYSKAKQILSWKPKISLEEGLRKTIDWMRKFDIFFKEPFRGWAKRYRSMLTKPS